MKNVWASKIREGSDIQSVLFDKKHFSVVQAKKWLRSHGFSGLVVDTTGNYHRFRQIEPSEFIDSSYRTIELTNGIKAIVGIPNRSNPVKKSLPFVKVFLDELSETSWKALPIQYTTSSHVYFFLTLNQNGMVELYAINQMMGSPCEQMAITGSFASMFNIPSDVKRTPLNEQIEWWNNHVSMVEFNDEPYISMGLFGTEYRNQYFYNPDGVLYKNIQTIENETITNDETFEVWSEGDMDNRSESGMLFFVSDLKSSQSMVIGISRTHLNKIIMSSL